jgi:hypothetical protein
VIELDDDYDSNEIETVFVKPAQGIFFFTLSSYIIINSLSPECKETQG